ncbi:MAG: branched-chain amino acid ABC transporter permease [Chloroflexi bacterium]|nr:branched-chain amino acid ABC transporter permease [Chloroflexota bacterium]
MALESQIVQLLFAGITVGSIYALIALGFVVIHNVTGIINFAQGEFAMLGALITITLSSNTSLFNRVIKVSFNLPLPIAIILAVLIVGVLGLLLYQVAIRTAKGASVVSLIIITIGASIALRGFSLIVWGTDPFSLPTFTKGAPIQFMGAYLILQNFWVIGTTLVILVLLYFFFERTMLGKALRACSINRIAARLMGIDSNKMAMFSFALSAAIGAIGGIVIAPSTPMAYESGELLGLKGFVAAIMGGMNSVSGAVMGGIVLGVLEALGAGFISSAYKDAIAFLVLFVILAARLSGLLGQGAKQQESGL